MIDITLWHNPRCSTSRAALALLRERGVEPRIVEYLRTPPTPAELEHVLALLGLEPRELIRDHEPAYAEFGLDEPTLSQQALIAAMAQHPILIQRPIAISGDRAALGRPPERVLDLLPG